MNCVFKMNPENVPISCIKSKKTTNVKLAKEIECSFFSLALPFALFCFYLVIL